MTREEALAVIAAAAQARYKRVNVPVAIRDALLNTSPKMSWRAREKVLEAIAVLVGGEWEDVAQ